MSDLGSLEIAFDDEHHALVARVEALTREAVEPIAGTEEESLDEAFDALVGVLATSGLLAETVAAPHGKRARLDSRSLCIVREGLAGTSGLADVIFVMQGLGSYALQIAGAPEIGGQWLPKVANGAAIAALALTEEHAGSDVAALRTTAVEDGDEYVIDGEKWFISNAGRASFYTVFANANPSAGRKGITAFLVEADRPGCRVVRQLPTLSTHPLGVVRFEGCRVPVAHRIGEVGEGFRLAMSTLDVFRATVGAAAIGMARRALREAIAFVKDRRQFGKALSEFQMTQAAIAEMHVDIEAARLLVYRAATARDRGLERVTLEASTAKLHATEAAQRVVDRALQLHGGRGLVRGSVTERLYRDVRALRIYEGTSEIQKLVIAARLLNA